jgi:N-acetylmuramoyl-L-alanine amidase
MVKNVTINAGHGGHDNGASRGTIYEKTINLTVALKLKDFLVAQGIQVNMTRSRDEYTSLSEITNIANANDSDLLISIHHNAGGGDGFEVYHSIYNGVGLELANKVADGFKSLNNSHGVAVKTKKGSDGRDYFSVIRNSVMPCILTEFGFMDTDDYYAFNTEYELEDEAIAIGKAICEQLGISIVEPKINYVLPLQKFLNELGITDVMGRKLAEDGIMGVHTQTVLDRLIRKL